MPLDAALIADLKSKHGDDLHSLGIPKGIDAVVIVKTPSAAVWERLQDKVMDPKATEPSKRAAAHNLLMDCLVHPSREVLASLLEKKPGLLQSLANQLTTIAGVEADLQAEKI